MENIAPKKLVMTGGWCKWHCFYHMSGLILSHPKNEVPMVLRQNMVSARDVLVFAVLGEKWAKIVILVHGNGELDHPHGC